MSGTFCGRYLGHGGELASSKSSTKLSIAIGPLSETGGVRTHISAFMKWSSNHLWPIRYSWMTPYFPRYRGLGSALHRHPAIPSWDIYGYVYRGLILGRFDLVHTHGHPFWPAPYASSSRPKRIHTVHQLYHRDDAVDERHWRLLRNLNEEMIDVCHRADCVISVSQALADDLLDECRLGSIVIPNGIEFDLSAPHNIPALSQLTSDDFFLFVGHSGRVKRPEMFIRLAYRFPGRRFVMVGPGLLPNTLKSAFGSIPDNLIAVGPMDNASVRWLMRNARVVVQTSVRESASITLLEAIAEGARVVAPGLPSNTEILPPDFPTFPADDFEKLVELAQWMWDQPRPDPILVQRLRSRHDIRRIAAKLDDLYREIVGG